MNAPFEALGPTVDFEVPLRYSDMDLFGHVNNARTSPSWKRRGLHGLNLCSRDHGTFASTACWSPTMRWTTSSRLNPGDRLIIRLGASGLGNSSIHIRYEGYVLKREEMPHNTLAFRAATTLVSWDTAAGKVIAGCTMIGARPSQGNNLETSGVIAG